ARGRNRVIAATGCPEEVAPHPGPGRLRQRCALAAGHSAETAHAQERLPGARVALLVLRIDPASALHRRVQMLLVQPQQQHQKRIHLRPSALEILVEVVLPAPAPGRLFPLTDVASPSADRSGTDAPRRWDILTRLPARADIAARAGVAGACTRSAA